MNFNKWALEYVFTCSMVAWHLDKKRFAWIMRTTLENWSPFYFKKLMRRLGKEGIVI